MTTDLHTLGVPSGITTPPAGDTGSREPAPVELQQCWRCSEPVAHALTNLCEGHLERFMDRVYHLTQDIGRGEL